MKFFFLSFIPFFSPSFLSFCASAYSSTIMADVNAVALSRGQQGSVGDKRQVVPQCSEQSYAEQNILQRTNSHISITLSFL